MKKKKITKNFFKRFSCEKNNLCAHHKYCIAIIVALSLVIIYGLLVYPGLLQTRGAPTPLNWTQNNWSGGATANNSTVTSGWTEYNSKNNININGSNQIELSTVTDTNTSLLIHGEGPNGSTSITDSSSFSHTITANGGAAISTADSAVGSSSIRFPNGNSNLSLSFTGSEFDISGDWTVEFWVKMDDISQTGDWFVIRKNAPVLPFNVNDYYFWAYRYAEQNIMALYMVTSLGNLTTGGNNSWGSALPNTWYHVTWQKKGDQLDKYINGQMITGESITTVADVLTAGADQITIGNLPYGGTRNFTGYIDELRVTRGIARYNSIIEPPFDFTPSTTPYTVTSFNSSGDLTSSIIDAGSTIEWSSADLTSTIDTGTSASVQVRTSTDGLTWSCEWTGGSACAENALTNGATSTSLTGIPNGRYAQYRTLLSTTDNQKTPVIQDVTLSGIVHLPNPALAYTDDVEFGPVLSDTITVDWDNAVVKKWRYNNNTSCSIDPVDYTDGATIPTQMDETNNGMYICLYAENDNGNISTLASANPVGIDITGPILSFIDIVLSGPVTSNLITGDWGDAVTKKWKYNDDNTTCSNLAGYIDGTSIPTQADQTNNNKYICLYGVDALGNASTISSTNSINIDVTTPPVIFTDNVEAGPVLSDDVVVDWADAVTKMWKYNSNNTCSVGPAGYDDFSTLPIQFNDEGHNGEYICLYGVDALGNFTLLSSNNPINIRLIPPIPPAYYTAQPPPIIPPQPTPEPITETKPATCSDTLTQIKTSVAPPFDQLWGSDYQWGDRTRWALDHMINIYQLYVDLLHRQPCLIEVDWWLQHDPDIFSIRYQILVSEEYRLKYGI